MTTEIVKVISDLVLCEKCGKVTDTRVMGFIHGLQGKRYEKCFHCCSKKVVQITPGFVADPDIHPKNFRKAIAEFVRNLRR